MLSQKNRLHKANDFKNIYQSGRRISSPYLIIRCKKHPPITKNKKPARFGFVVSNKILKSIVERNRLKRQLRSIIRSQINKTTTGFDCIISAKPRIAELNYQAVEKEIKKLLKTTNLF